MPDIEFSCPFCKNQLVVEDDMGGQTVACPACGKDVTIPAGLGGGPPAAAVDIAAHVPTTCKFCGFPMEQDAVLCIHCGRTTSGKALKQKTVRALTWRLVAPVAAILIVLLAAGTAIGLALTRQARRKQALRDLLEKRGLELQEQDQEEKEKEQLVAEQERKEKEEQKLVDAETQKQAEAEQEREQEELGRKQAVAAEERRLELEETEARIRALFPMEPTGQAVRKVRLKDGSRFQAASFEIDGADYVFRVPNENRTIYASRVVPKSDVADIGEQAPDERVWDVLRTIQPGPNSENAAYYEKLIELCFDRFLTEHPSSLYADRVRTLKDLWTTELTSVRKGYRKIQKRWYAPGQDMPHLLPPRTRQQFALVTRMIGNTEYYKAIQIASRIRIPDDDAFANDRRRQAMALLQALEGLEREISANLAEVKARADKSNAEYQTKRQTIKGWTFERQLGWGDGRNRLAQARKEAAKEDAFLAKKKAALNALEKRRRNETAPILAEKEQIETEIEAVRSLAGPILESVRHEATRDAVQNTISRISALK